MKQAHVININVVILLFWRCRIPRVNFEKCDFGVLVIFILQLSHLGVEWKDYWLELGFQFLQYDFFRIHFALRKWFIQNRMAVIFRFLTSL